MATRIVTSPESKIKIPFMYQTDTPVGNGATNKKRSDNQLVQLFLRTFYNLNPELFKRLPKPPGPRVQTTAIDGKVGPQTVAGITVFQEDTIRVGGSATIVDGRVSVPTGFRVTGTNHIFTIFQLNTFFFKSNEQNALFNANLEDHPQVKLSCPELAAELSLQRTLRDLLE